MSSAPASVQQNSQFLRLWRALHNRKNWLFCWTEIGAKYVGIVHGLIATCRLHDIDPFTYLVDVLQHVATHPAAEVNALTPRLWKQLFAANPLRSAVNTRTDSKD